MATIKVRHTIGYHIRSDQFSDKLKEALDTGEEVEIHVNSPGGSVYQGWEMFNELKMSVAEGADISVYNIGLAASMASIFMLGVPKEDRYMAKSSMFMIHNPSGIAFGDREEMEKEADLLDKIEDLMSESYADETDTSIEYMKARMKATTWYKPSEAKEEGFITNIVDGYEDVEKAKVKGMKRAALGKPPSNCEDLLCFDNDLDSIRAQKKCKDLTKITNSQIRERIWKNF